jgi:GT2 family glycosyltransferase
MSVTILVPAKNDPGGLTRRCLASAAHSCRTLNIKPDFILVSDHSDEQEEIIRIFTDFRASNPDLSVRIFRAKKWLHYTGVFSLGLSAATRGDIFFLSNDMLITPYFLTAVFGVAGLADKPGTIRGTSTHADGHPEYSIAPPMALNGFDDVLRFSGSIYTSNALLYEPVRFFSGDAVLVKRALIDEIGVMDLRFFGYYGDVDYGIRAQLAGFNLICAKGAWLYHAGGGHMTREVEKSGEPWKEHKAKRMRLVHDAYRAFRAKWKLPTPEVFSGVPDFFDLVRPDADRKLRYDLPPDFWADVQEV